MNGNPGKGRGLGVRARTPARRIRKCLAVALAAVSCGAAPAAPDYPPGASAPTEPVAGAAGRNAAPGYPHRSVRREEYGSGGRSYWLFEPAGPVPRRAPVIVFNHGWLAVNPGNYGAWIEHLVRSGNVVIFPRYQRDPLTRPQKFLPNAVAAVTDAFGVLSTAPGHVRPDRRRFALIGHSAGGNLAVQMAAVADGAGLPRPRAVLALMPGEVVSSREPDLADFPRETLLVVAVAENDAVVGDARAREIFEGTTRVPRARKRFIYYRTDLHGLPGLVADHFLATGYLGRFDTGEGVFPRVQKQRAEVNAFDRAGLWPLADLTLRAAFDGRTLNDLADGGDRFRRLGSWSDGRPVSPPVVADDLAAVPRVFPTNGLRLIRSVVTGNPPAAPAADPAVEKVAGLRE